MSSIPIVNKEFSINELIRLGEEKNNLKLAPPPKENNSSVDSASRQDSTKREHN